ncbi:MAG: histidinol-phosphate transaminase [bacterium]|nr:MAG: histidinol-phosphate transaminase [bacterium]
MASVKERLVPEAIRGLEAYAPPEGKHPVRLNANENPFALPEPVMGKIRAVLGACPLNRYPDPSCRNLRDAFARRFGCRSDHVMAGNGSDELIALLLWTFRRGSSTGSPAVMVPSPTFNMYVIGALAAGFEVERVPLTADLKLDIDEMIRRTRRVDPNILFLSNPNNPTGTVFGQSEVKAVLEACRGVVVVDEAYGDFSREPTWCPHVEEYPNLVVLRTLSKVGGAALRCGFMVAQPDLIEEVNKVRQPFNVGTLTQEAGTILLEHFHLIEKQIEDVIVQRDTLAAGLAEGGLTVFPSAANFLLVQAEGREAQLSAFLHRQGIVVKFLPRLDVVGDALRITVGTAEENKALLEGVKTFSC